MPNSSMGRKVLSRTGHLSVNKRSPRKAQWEVFESWVNFNGPVPNPERYPELVGTRCHIWVGRGRIGSVGYGSFLGRAASVWLWEYLHGPITTLDPKRTRQGRRIRQDICHRCDMPPCVNPLHLELRPHDDNVADRKARGRYWKTAHERRQIAERMRINNPSRRRTPEQREAWAAKMRAFWADPERSAALRAKRTQQPRRQPRPKQERV